MQGSDNFRLVVRRGPQPNQVYDLNKDTISLGRDITNDIVINDPEVSRHHLRLTRGVDGYQIEDLGSTNGTFVNGQRLSAPRQLNNGDMIGLGETVTLGYERARPAVTGAPAPEAARPAEPSPYQPPQPAQAAPAAYQPPPSPMQPSPSSYQPPQDQYGGAQQAPYYPPQSGQPAYDQYGGYAPQAPQATGYDYDPYAVREEGGSNALRWVGIGCGVLGVVCVCSSLVALVLIDSLRLWDSVPFLRDLLLPFARAFGF